MQIPYGSIKMCAERIGPAYRVEAQEVLDWLETMAAKRPPQPVTPRPGQVWQKLNVGTKTATRAPRITVLEQALDMVSVKNAVGQIRRMRIATLQRDWHCLNPEI